MKLKAAFEAILASLKYELGKNKGILKGYERDFK